MTNESTHDPEPPPNTSTPTPSAPKHPPPNPTEKTADNATPQNADSGGDDIFHGWLSTSPTSSLTYGAFAPKAWRETDVDIKVTHCGVCASDLHVLRSGWGETLYPCLVGHEIIGHATRIGTLARPGLHPGDRVGVGPQGFTCRLPTCPPCSRSTENYCPNRVGTYGDRYADGSGVSHGGFADFTRHDSGSVFSIPDALASEDASVMLCAGATVYEPLKEGGAGPGVEVGIVGVGGLGHLGVLFAKAMGCARVVAFSRKREKAADAMALGADAYVATAEDDNGDDGWQDKHAASLDLIICTVSDPRMPLHRYLTLLRPKGRFCQVGIPEAPLPPLDAMSLVLNGTSICFSDSASPGNIREMLQLAADKGIKAWTQTRPMAEVNTVLQDMEDGKARFRYVLTNNDGDGDGR
ncbi:MAG: hypothetical protein Q9182_004253 [Xanthomendoza sp. 2 TL-2023]